MPTVANAEVTVAVNGFGSRSSPRRSISRVRPTPLRGVELPARSRRTTSCGSATPRASRRRRRGEPRSRARPRPRQERGYMPAPLQVEPRTVDLDDSMRDSFGASSSSCGVLE